ncbi:hypothetical protein PybrP1_008771 [[Pythium] brassicae (nom. inval.)]|nr:hypothetical protein PybrP1_008771 [[Pythium] brassicae (nom. inval.)]
MGALASTTTTASPKREKRQQRKTYSAQSIHFYMVSASRNLYLLTRSGVTRCMQRPQKIACRSVGLGSWGLSVTIDLKGVRVHCKHDP